MKINLSGCAIIENNKLLLLWKIKHQHYEFPGGKVEKNETLEQTAIRECKEELNTDIKLQKYLGYEEFIINNKSYRSHKYLGEIKNNQTPKVAEPEEFEKLFWLPIKKYKDFTCAPNVKKFCQKIIDGEIVIS
jgi:8-oxo-dGTP pyrophosphatase MutT (NUDIX family)